MHAPTQADDAVFIRVSVGRCYISFPPPVAMAKYSYKSSLKKGRFVLLRVELALHAREVMAAGAGSSPSHCMGSQDLRARDVLPADFLLLVLFLTPACGTVPPTFKVWLVSLLPAWLTSSS